MIAFAAREEPSPVMEEASRGAVSSIGSIGSTWPITPVEATITSDGSMLSALPAISHIRHAFSSPSALQVFALPELQITALATPFVRLRFVTRIGAPLTRLLVYMPAAVQGAAE